MYVTSLSSMAIRARWPMTCGCIVRMNNPRSSYAPSNSAFQIENTSSGVMVGRTVDARSIQKLREVVEDPFDRQLHDTRGLPGRYDLVRSIVGHQAAVIE